MVLRNGNHGQRAGRLERPLDQVRSVDWIIPARLLLAEAVAETLLEDPERPPIGPGLDLTLSLGIGPEIVDAVHLIGVLMGPDHRVDALDLGIQQLRAHIGRRVDQYGLAAILDQDRAAPTPVARVTRVGGAPLPLALLAAQPRHATGGAAAQDGHPHAPRSALANRRKKFSVVAASSSPTLMPFNSATLAAVWVTKAGSLVLPRFGTGAR